ncbi:MAG: MFS transporter [Thermoprotei archaeon]
MVQYKWVALSNTSLGVIMSSINGTITLISLPAIFRGININPFNSFQYLLWVLFGYNVVTATLLVTFGRLSDMFGRVRLYNMGFAVFTAGSILLSLTPNSGHIGALEIVVFRIIQGVGGAFLFSNRAAILTDAVPGEERGKALGINQISALTGSFIGLVLGGILAQYNWRYVFLVSVPFGLFGTVWSYTKLRELGKISRSQSIDWGGNITFGAGLTIVLVGITYGLLPYGSSPTGWGNPWVIAAMVVGVALLAAFPFIEMRVKYPMFRLSLFRIRMFTAANFAGLLGAIGRGGVMLMLIILLQGIWLPLHGYSYSSTPFWAGVYMVPLSLGFIVMGPLSGWLSDRYGARGLATLGMLITAAGFLLLARLPYDFSYPIFALIIFFMGVGNGMFAAPNTASIMNSLPLEHRGAGSGMRATLQNTGQTISLGIFFTIVILGLTTTLPGALYSSLVKAGVPTQIAQQFSNIPPTGALFAAFLGYDPVRSILSSVPSNLATSIPPQAISVLEAKTWFPSTIAPPFVSSLHVTFYVGAALSILAAVSSALRGQRTQITQKVGEAVETQGRKIVQPGEAVHAGSNGNANSKVKQRDGENG